METRPPLPPFDHATAVRKVRLAEDGWDSRDPARVALAYTSDSRWRNRSTFINGREEIVDFLAAKWARELDYRLVKELWAFTADRIAVRFVYEWHDAAGQWFRSHGNENWAFTAAGLMHARHASINDVAIPASQRLFLWPSQGSAIGDAHAAANARRRPDDHPDLGELGL